jgi:hypothetical protein
MHTQTDSLAFMTFRNRRLPMMGILFLGGWLAIALCSTTAQAQRGVVEGLPPVPPSVEINPSGSVSLPQLQPGASSPEVEFRQQNQQVQQFSAPPASPPAIEYQNNQQYSRSYSSNSGKYLVLVENSNYQMLQQVRQIEPGAFITNRYQGRSLIQVGVFGRPENAQQRIMQLERKGISGARAVSLNNGIEIPRSPGGGYYPGSYSPSRRNNYTRNNSDAYYVAIPADSNDLPKIEDKIRRNTQQSISYLNVVRRTNPRGPHVAVGPFNQRTQAEQWNSYLRNLGFGNARVYYGK